MRSILSLSRAHRSGMEQVAKERLVAFTLADYPEHQAWIADLFAPLNRSPQIVEEHDSITSLIAAVESGRGIGFAIATGLACEGARVIVNGRSEKSVAEAKGQIEQAVADARIESFAGDLSTAAAAETLLQRFPLVDILVNSLGIFEPKPFEDISDEDWRRFFEVNVLSGVRLSRAYLPGMKQRNWGRIVFISSESAINTPAEMIHYGMTKTAQLAVSRGLAQLCAGTGVTVNAVLPGPTHSPGVDEFVNQLDRKSVV